MRLFVCTALVLSAMVSCATVIPHVTSVDAQRTGVSIEELETGRTLLVSRCGTCHLVPEPRSHTAAEWSKLLPEMLEKSHFTDVEAQQLLTYLQTVSAPNASVAAAATSSRAGN